MPRMGDHQLPLRTDVDEWDDYDPIAESTVQEAWMDTFIGRRTIDGERIEYERNTKNNGFRGGRYT